MSRPTRRGLLANFTTARQGCRGGTFPPDVRDVLLRDVTLTHADVPHEIAHVSNLKFERVRVNGTTLTLPGNA